MPRFPVCVGASPQQLFMNTISFFFPRSCWNDGSDCVTTSSVLPENLATRIGGVSEPKKTGCVSCAACERKRNKCWSVPHWWLISRYRERRAPKTATFPASFPRGWPEGKGYSLAVDGGEPMEWKGEEIGLPLPVCQCCCLCLCVGTLSAASVPGESSVFYHLSISTSRYTILPRTVMGWGIGHGKRSSVLFICVVVVISIWRGKTEGVCLGMVGWECLVFFEQQPKTCKYFVCRNIK